MKDDLTPNDNFAEEGSDQVTASVPSRSTGLKAPVVVVTVIVIVAFLGVILLTVNSDNGPTQPTELPANVLEAFERNLTIDEQLVHKVAEGVDVSANELQQFWQAVEQSKSVSSMLYVKECRIAPAVLAVKLTEYTGTLAVQNVDLNQSNLITVGGEQALIAPGQTSTFSVPLSGEGVSRIECGDEETLAGVIYTHQ